VILADGGLDLRSVHPGNEVFECARDEEGGVGDHFRTDAHVTLLDEGDSLLQRLTHVKTNHQHGKTTPGRGRARRDQNHTQTNRMRSRIDCSRGESACVRVRMACLRVLLSSHLQKLDTVIFSHSAIFLFDGIKPMWNLNEADDNTIEDDSGE
jgi:hypothetical protein